LKRAAGRARQPWVHEDEALKELSKRVAELKRGEGAGDQRESASPGGSDREHRGESRDHASLPEETEE
jgi:hypothetical protein